MTHRNEPGALRLKTFGGLSVHCDGIAEAYVGEHRKRLALLAVLAAAGESGRSRDKLLALLWPESDATRARNSLKQALFCLRRDLGDSLFQGTTELRLNPQVITSDVGDFFAAAARTDHASVFRLYEGPFLDGAFIAGAPEFEHWVDGIRTQTFGIVREAHLTLAKSADERGDLARARSHLERLMALDRLDGLAALELTGTLARLGDSAGAIRLARAHIAAVRSELGSDPSPALAQLVGKIESGQFARALPTALPPSRPSAAIPESPLDRDEARAVPPTDSLGSDPHVFTGNKAPAQRRNLPRFAITAIGAVLASVALLAWYRRPAAAPAARPASPSATTRQTNPVVRAAAATPAESPARADSSTSAPRPPRQTPSPRPLGDGRRILVAALENQTGDSSLSNVGVLAADWIAQGVQQTGMVTVVDPLSTVAALRRRAADTVGARTGFARAALMAHDADAGVVVWGAVYRQADSLVFRARISDVSRGRLLATIAPISSPVANPMSGATRLRERVAGALAALTDRKFASVTSGSEPPTFEAYAEYMTGLALFQQFKYGEACRHFAAAAALDTSFTTPLVWSALAFDGGGNLRARDSVTQILADRRERGPLEAFALDYLRAEQRHDRSAMLIAARGAAQLMPGSNWSHYAGLLALGQNRLREASHWFAQIDPEHGWAQRWPPFWEAYMATSHLLGEYDKEANLARRGLELGSDPLTCRLHLLASAIGNHRIAEANALLEDIVRTVSAYAPSNVVRLVGPTLAGAAAEFRAHGFSKEADETLDRALRWFRSSEADDIVRASRQDTARARAFIRRSQASALYEAGRYDEAAAMFAGLDSSYAEPRRSYLGLIAAHRGDRDAAERALVSLDSLNDDPFAIALDQARILCALGEPDRAMRRLEFAVSGYPRPFSSVHVQREWDAVRANIKTSYDPERTFAQPGLTLRR